LVLSDVEPPGARQILVRVVGQAGEVLGAGAVDPVLLERPALAVLLGDEQVGDAERPEQPLVARRHEEVGAQPGDVERHRAEGLAPVDDEQRSGLSRMRSHAREVDQRAVGPVHVGNRYQPHAFVERSGYRLRPCLRRAAVDGDHLRAVPLGPGTPRVHGRWEVVGDHQHAVSPLGIDVVRGRREPVARCGDQGNALGVGADQTRKERAQLLGLVEPFGGADGPGLRPARKRLLAGCADGAKQGRQARAVEVGEITGNPEQVALVWEV
jgi:hypothetical protein